MSSSGDDVTIPPVPTMPRGDASDEELLRAHREGDPSAFGELVERYQVELYQFLARFTGDRTAADDLFQESFLQVHQSMHQFDLTRRFRPWLFTIAANKARDWLRSQSRRPASPLQANIHDGDSESGEFMDLLRSPIEVPESMLERQELRERVQWTVMSMPEHLREILLLGYFNQFPYKQISEMLDIPLGTVKSRLHAAVAHFAEKWKSANRESSGT